MNRKDHSDRLYGNTGEPSQDWQGNPDLIQLNIIWILAFLGLIGLLGSSSIILAEDGKWTRKANMPTARWGLSTNAVNGKIYAIGGWAADVALAAVEEYDPMTDIWTKKSDMPTARFLLSTSVVNGKIYAIGGAPNPGAIITTVEEYDTGFTNLGIEAKGKFVTSWGKIKSNHESLKKHE